MLRRSKRRNVSESSTEESPMKDAKIKSEVEQSEDVYVDAQLVRCTFAQMYYQLLTRIAF